ncbi:hypothetical protein FOCC_FOCC013861 [Frankliniella occidentalis]|nr:hypothetical protein FOCC_FOCC013861 [Frankliniella occidentalis]
MEISCEQSDVTNQCSEHVENVRDGLDKITFSDSMTNSPWKVTPLRDRLSTENENLKAALKASEEKLDKARNDFNQNLMQQSEEFEKKLKEADAVFKVKLQQEQAKFELIIKQLEDNLSLKSKELEETCQKFQNREYYLNLKLKESGDGFTLRSKELEENCQKFKNVECDLNSKLKQGENELRVMQKSRDTFKMQLHSLSSETEELRKKMQLQSKNLEIFTKVSNALKNEKQEYKKKLQASKERLLFKNFITEDNIAHYTGLPNIGTFYWLLSMVQQDIQYYFGSAVKCLTNEDQLFITLFKLRRNVSHQLLADLFEVSLFTVSNTLITWISVLHIIVVEGIMEKNVPSLHKVRQSMPEAFSMYPNCRMIFDCTEVEVQVPSLMSNHNEVYSSYKSRTTFKALIVIAPNGTIIYVSDLFPGSTSDKVLVYNCGVLDLLKAGDAVMADKGFPIGDLLPPGVDLNLPPFKETPQFTRGQVMETLKIARSRIHVERAILRVKYFHILDKIPQSLFKFSSKVFQVCAGLTNLRCSLIKEVEDDMKS